MKTEKIKNNNEYRIREYAGRFMVQLKQEYYKRKLFKKIKVTEWIRCDIYGRRSSFTKFGRISPPLKEFATLKEAENKIKEFNKKAITYYYIDSNKTRKEKS